MQNKLNNFIFILGFFIEVNNKEYINFFKN